MKIRFLENYTVKAVNGQSFKAGEVYDLPAPSANHFLRKKRAEVVGERAAPIVENAKPQAKQPEDKPLGTTKRGKPSRQPPAKVFDQGEPDPMAGLDDETV